MNAIAIAHDSSSSSSSSSRNNSSSRGLGCRAIHRRVRSPRRVSVLLRWLVVASSLLLSLSCEHQSPASVLVSVSARPIQPTPAAQQLESAFPDAAAGDTHSDTRGVYTVQGSVNTIVTELYGRSARAYSGVDEHFQHHIIDVLSNTVLRQRFVTGVDDFAILTVIPTPAEIAMMPGLRHYPLQSNVVVMPYVLPANITLGQQLSFSASVLCRITRANITRWNDPELVALNPKMALHLAVDPHSGLGQPIVMVQSTNFQGTSLTWTRYCSKVDPEFAATIPVAGVPQLPWSRFATPPRLFGDMDLLNAVFPTITWGFCFMPHSLSAQYNYVIASFTGAQGELVVPSTHTAMLNLVEMVTDTTGNEAFDLTKPLNAHAWPMMSISYVWLDVHEARTTCATKQIMVEFLLWFLQSTVAAAIAQDLHGPILPALLVSRLRLVERLTTEVLCDGAALSTVSRASRSIGSHALGVPVLQLFSHFYLGVDPSTTFDVATMPEQLALWRLGSGDILLAAVNAAALADEQLQWMEHAQAAMLPAFLAGVVPIFALPTAITALYAMIAATADITQLDPAFAALPPLYPLTLDLDTTARIFLGNLTSWLDPDLLSLNPQLSPWWAAAGNPSSALSVIVGATDPSDSVAGGRLLLQAIRHSDTIRRMEFTSVRESLSASSSSSSTSTAAAAAAASAAHPFASIVSSHPHMHLIDIENRLTLKTATVPGAVSYRLMPETPNTHLEFQIVQTNSQGQREIVSPTVGALDRCGQDLTSLPSSSDADGIHAAVLHLLDPSTQAGFVNVRAPSPGCWPLSTLLSFVVSTQHRSAVQGAGCSASLHVLEFLHCSSTQRFLTPPANSFGLGRLAVRPMVGMALDEVMGRVQCDGQALMRVPPQLFVIPASIDAFGTGVGIVYLIVLCGSIAFVLSFRSHRDLVQESSVGFQLALLLGMSLLSCALLQWTVAPTDASCASFMWLTAVGFSVLYGMQVASLWQAWRMTTLSSAEAHKRAVSRLFGLTRHAEWLIGGLLACDGALLLAWQLTGPLRPMEFDRSVAGRTHVFTHCSINSSSVSALSILILQLILKAGVLLAGTVLSLSGSMQHVAADAHLSRRRSFVLSATARRMRRSLYCLFGSSLVIFGVVVIVSAVESTLLLLIQLFFVINVAACWLLMFAPRFWKVMQQQQQGKSDPNGGRQDDPERGHYSSIGFKESASAGNGAVTMSAASLLHSHSKLQAYVQAMQQQLQTAATELTRLKPSSAAAAAAPADTHCRPSLTVHVSDADPLLAVAISSSPVFSRSETENPAVHAAALAPSGSGSGSTVMAAAAPAIAVGRDGSSSRSDAGSVDSSPLLPPASTKDQGSDRLPMRGSFSPVRTASLQPSRHRHVNIRRQSSPSSVFTSPSSDADPSMPASPELPFMLPSATTEFAITRISEATTAD